MRSWKRIAPLGCVAAATALAPGCFGGRVPGTGLEDGGYGVAPDLAPLCTGNNDGVIESRELLFPVGATVRYLMNPPGTTVQVAPDGTQAGGALEWDLRSTMGEVRDFTLIGPAGAWWAPRFPAATYAVIADVGTDTLGVFRVGPDGLFLLGFASVDPDRTLLVYDKEVLSLRFPVKKGDGWVTGGKITDGKLDGKPFASTDTYRIQVDAAGTAAMPYLKFHNTLRVRLDSTQAIPAGVSVTRIQHLFYHECYGELGRMVSNFGEANPSFQTAVEFRRLAL